MYYNTGPSQIMKELNMEMSEHHLKLGLLHSIVVK